jgi:hypothetical protein
MKRILPVSAPLSIILFEKAFTHPGEGLAAAFRLKVSSPTEDRSVARAIRNLRKGFPIGTIIEETA